MNLREQLNQISVKYQKGGIVKIVDQKGNLIKINRDSDQYSNLYNNKLIQGYDPKTDTYYLYPSHESVVYKSTDTQSSNEIPEIVLKGKKADWVKYKEDYMKNNPKEKYIQEYLDAYPWAHQSLTNYPKRLDEGYENMVNDYIGEQIVKNKPQGNKSREDWLNSMTEQEQRFVQRNPKYGTTLWQDTVEGGKALFNLSNDLQISRIKNSDNYTNLEKKDLIQQHGENPILSNIGDVAQSLSFLTVPSKMVQSTLRPEYSFSDAIQGTKNKASVLEDFGTDPLNLVGIGAWNKLSKASKFSKSLESINIENILTDAEKYLTTKTPLKNTYKYNPWAFKPNPEAYYRTLGKEGIDDAFNSGVIRPKQSHSKYSPEVGKRINVNTPEFPEGSYFNKSGIYSNNKVYNPEYITEVVGKDELFTYPERIVFNENIRVAPKDIPIEQANFYKKDWLQGYKPIEVPESRTYNKFSNSNFKSEINWGNWNKEIPDNPQLIQEYNAIEQTSKANGTWMKNPDGSMYLGPRERWIQEQSINFKKAYPDGFEVTSRGIYSNKLDGEQIAKNYPKGRGIFGGDPLTAHNYSKNGKPMTNMQDTDGVYQLYYPKTKEAITIDAKGRSWREVPTEGLKGVPNEKTDLANVTRADTDDIATWLELNNKPSVKIKNVFDGVDAKYVDIINHKPGNYLKSMFGNNGMFDMTNPNIYKTLVPGAIGLGVLQQKRNGGVIKDNNGYWNPDNWGKGVKKDSNINLRKQLNQIYIKYQNGGVTDREIQVLKNTAKDNVNQSKQFELEYLNSPKFKERAIKAGYDYDTLKKQLYKNISTQKTNFYNDNGKTNGAFFNPSDNSLNFGISKNEDFEDGLINVNGDTVAHEIGHQFSSGKNLDMTKQNDLLEKSNFLLPKDFIGKVKRGYEIATNPNYYQEDGHETFNSETIADIHSARKELFDKTGIDLRYSNMTDEAFDIMLKDAFKRKENSFERIFSKIGKDKNKEILNDYFFKSTDPNEIDQIYKKYNTDEKIQKLKKDAEKAMRDNKDVIMNLMNRVVDNNDNNQDLFYAQEGGSLNNIRNILNNMYNRYE